MLNSKIYTYDVSNRTIFLMANTRSTSFTVVAIVVDVGAAMTTTTTNNNNAL